jgi:ABC-type dipeptide/oligopeptide/nickel transport system permease component
MGRYIANRLVQLVPVLFLISVIIFGVLHALPGDPAELILQGAEGGAPPERLRELREAMGLNDPLLVQYLRFVGHALLGDLGESIRFRTSVSGPISRLVRSSMIEVLGEDYIRTSRAKGLEERLVLWRHGFSNALIPVVTMVGLTFGGMLAGAVVTETVFSRPGLGRLVVSAILTKDYPLVQGCVLFLAVLYLIVNLAVDVLYAWLDPRIRYGA